MSDYIYYYKDNLMRDEKNDINNLQDILLGTRQAIEKEFYNKQNRTTIRQYKNLLGLSLQVHKNYQQLDKCRKNLNQNRTSNFNNALRTTMAEIFTTPNSATVKKRAALNFNKELFEILDTQTKQDFLNSFISAINNRTLMKSLEEMAVTGSLNPTELKNALSYVNLKLLTFAEQNKPIKDLSIELNNLFEEASALLLEAEYSAETIKNYFKKIIDYLGYNNTISYKPGALQSTVAGQFGEKFVENLLLQAGALRTEIQWTGQRMAKNFIYDYTQRGMDPMSYMDYNNIQSEYLKLPTISLNINSKLILKGKTGTATIKPDISYKDIGVSVKTYDLNIGNKQKGSFISLEKNNLTTLVFSNIENISGFSNDNLLLLTNFFISHKNDKHNTLTAYRQERKKIMENLGIISIIAAASGYRPGLPVAHVITVIDKNSGEIIVLSIEHLINKISNSDRYLNYILKNKDIFTKHTEGKITLSDFGSVSKELRNFLDLEQVKKNKFEKYFQIGIPFSDL